MFTITLLLLSDIHSYGIFIIHSFVLQVDNMFATEGRKGGTARGEGWEINNGDKSRLVRGEKKGWVTYDWSPRREICMAFSAARGEELI